MGGSRPERGIRLFYCVWRERKRSGGSSSKLEKARSQSRVLRDSMILVYWYGGDMLAYRWIRTAHILTAEVLGDSSAWLVCDASLWQWSQEDICSALVNAQLAYHLSSDLPVHIFASLTGLFICLSGWSVFKCVPIWIVCRIKCVCVDVLSGLLPKHRWRLAGLLQLITIISLLWLTKDSRRLCVVRE